MNIFTKLTSAAAIAFFATAVNAQDINFDGPLDTDGDGMLTEEEFAPVAAMGGTFVGFDADGDGMVSQIEYNESVDSLLIGGNENDLNSQQIEEQRALQRMFDQANADRDLIEGIVNRNAERTQ